MGIELKKKRREKKSTNWKPNHKGLLSGNGYTTSRINHMLYWLWWNVACHFFGMENSMTSCMYKALYTHATLYMVRCSFDSAQLLNILNATIAANKRNQTVSIELHRRPWKKPCAFLCSTSGPWVQFTPSIYWLDNFKRPFVRREKEACSILPDHKMKNSNQG